jgi:hypothetical protein
MGVPALASGRTPSCEGSVDYQVNESVSLGGVPSLQALGVTRAGRVPAKPPAVRRTSSFDTNAAGVARCQGFLQRAVRPRGRLCELARPCPYYLRAATIGQLFVAKPDGTVDPYRHRRPRLQCLGSARTRSKPPFVQCVPWARIRMNCPHFAGIDQNRNNA